MKVEFHKSDIMGNVFRLLEDLTIENAQMRSLNTTVDITVPAGAESDGASVPRFLWRLVFPPTDSKAIRAACVHDWIYRHGYRLGEYIAAYRLTREDADGIFYDLLIEDGVPAWRATLAFIGVRLFGQKSWKGYKKNDF